MDIVIFVMLLIVGKGCEKMPRIRMILTGVPCEPNGFKNICTVLSFTNVLLARISKGVDFESIFVTFSYY